MIKKSMLALVALVGLSSTQAATPPTVTITWSKVTTNTDNTVITDPVTYQLYVGTSGNEVAFKTPVTSPPYVIVPTPAPGTQVCAQVTATAAGVESTKSVEVCGVVPKPTPNAPGNMKLTIQ